MPQPSRGDAAEAAVLYAFVKRNLNVLVPFGDGQPYDLVVDLTGGKFLRVQCKTAWPDDGCMRFNCRATDHGRGPRFVHRAGRCLWCVLPAEQRCLPGTDRCRGG